MADSEQITSLIKDLEEMKDGLGSLNDLMEGTQQVSDSLLKSFQNFATTGSSATLWGAVSRFSSGIFPGFWSLQNKIRAVAVYMQYVEKKQKEQIQAEGKIAKTIRDQSKVRNEAFKVFDILQSKNLSVMQEMTLEQDAYYQTLKAQLGAEEARLKYQEVYKDSILENVNAEMRLASSVRERIRNEQEYAKYFEVISATQIRDLEKVLYFREQEEEVVKRKRAFQGQLQSTVNKFGRGEITEEEMEATVDEINKTLNELDDSLNAARGTRKLVEKETGIKIKPKLGLLEQNPEKKKTREEMIKGLSEYVTKYIKSFPLIAKTIATIKWLGKPMNRKLLIGYAKIGLDFLKKAMLYFVGIGLVVFAIIQSGIIGRVIDFFERVKNNKLFSVVIEVITVAIQGFKEFFGGIFNLFYGLFTGDMDRVIKGLKDIIMGFSKLFVGVLLSLPAMILAGLPSLLFELGQMIGQIILDFGSYIIGSASNVATGIGALSGAFAGAKIGAAGGPLGILAGAVIGGTLGGIGGAALGDMLGLASGGRVNQGGNILVGEAGPEIVSLPTNSFVTPAVQSRAMMGNNITVQVNGRVGASDSELNEIARKIGQKINREMNKYGSSGYRA